MLNRKYRATRITIESTIKTGATIPGIFLYAKVSRHSGEKAGFAIVVSKKIDKTSVGRHRIKRKISSFLEASIKNIDINFKKTIVFFVKEAKNPLFYSQVEKDMKEILTKADFFAK